MVATPSTETLLTQWNWAPSLLVGIALLIAVYSYAVGPWRRQHDAGPPVSRKQLTMFVLSIVALVIALLSPLDAVGDTYLFSAHMIQHLLLATLWPPLLLMAVPGWLVRRLYERPVVRTVMGFLAYPVVALLAFNIDVYAWHMPALYDLTLSNEGVHILEHLSFMVFGLLNWWPVLSPATEQRLSYPFQILYLILDGMVMMVLGILFTFAPTAFYSPYVSAPRLWDISASTDQEIGGLIMWYPGNVPYAVLIVLAFYRWFDGEEPYEPETQRINSQSPSIGPPVT